MSGEVYFIEGGGRIKIGYSLDAEKRLRGLSTGSSHRLKIIGRMPGSVSLERAIHKKLSEYCVQGEWFEDCSWTREVIQALLTEGASAIGYNFVPPKKAKRKPRMESANDLSPFSTVGGPISAAINRIDAASDPYVSEKVVEARHRERTLGLVPGTLINPLINAYFTPVRLAIATKMILEIWDQASDLNRVIFDAIFDGTEVPDNVHADLLNGFAQTLRIGLKALFASPDLDMIDLGPFVWVVPPTGGDLRKAQLRSPDYRFSYGRRLDHPFQSAEEVAA